MKALPYSSIRGGASVAAIVRCLPETVIMMMMTILSDVVAPHIHPPESLFSGGR